MVIILKKTLEKKGADDVIASRANLGPVSTFYFCKQFGAGNVSSPTGFTCLCVEMWRRETRGSWSVHILPLFQHSQGWNRTPSRNCERFMTDSQDVTSVEQCRRLWLWMEDNQVTHNCIIITANRVHCRLQSCITLNKKNLLHVLETFRKIPHHFCRPLTKGLRSLYDQTLLITFTKTYFQADVQTRWFITFYCPILSFVMIIWLLGGLTQNLLYSSSSRHRPWARALHFSPVDSWVSIFSSFVKSSPGLHSYDPFTVAWFQGFVEPMNAVLVISISKRRTLLHSRSEVVVQELTQSWLAGFSLVNVNRGISVAKCQSNKVVRCQRRWPWIIDHLLRLFFK